MTVPKRCRECGLFVGIECVGQDPVYGMCDRDWEQVRADNPACDFILECGGARDPARTEQTD